MLCKNDVIELMVDNLGYRGEGVARVDGIPVFIDGALPGEKVRALIILVKKSFYVAKLLEVLISSIERVSPVCPHFSKCGGCNLQHLDYSCQLEYKKEQIEDALKKIAGTKARVSSIYASPLRYGYRNKISIPVRKEGARAVMGLYAYNSHRIIEIDSCPLQSEKINELIGKLKKLVNKFDAFDELSGSGELKHFVAREIGGKISLTFVVSKNIAGKIKRIIAEESGLADEIWMNINPSNTNVILGKQFEFLVGQIIKEKLFGFKTSIHPAGFLQVNYEVADAIYEKVMQLTKSLNPDVVIDAYCGGGMLTAKLASVSKKVYGIEIVEEAIQSAIDFHKDHNIQNTEMIAGNCATVLPKIVSKAKNELVVLDPPRTGCDDEVINAVNASEANNVIYISCNPATLARDLAKLTSYDIKEICAFDMFAQTCHVETVCLLTKK
ncbi:MAG: 23S rRNA (uracil(1939)-C(5))-methyltransferase RlmD [Clostridia bacterium]|nr:23S rRNA (uracil(1939)-C(5))-methyltransferase RlmD [Clostridia bacterium]